MMTNLPELVMNTTNTIRKIDDHFVEEFGVCRCKRYIRAEN